MTETKIFGTTLNGKNFESYSEELKKVFEHFKTTPVAIVLNPKTTKVLISAIEKAQEKKAPTIRDYCNGLELYSSDKVPEGFAKVAYTREEIAEICETGMTKAEKEQFKQYERLFLRGEQNGKI